VPAADGPWFSPLLLGAAAWLTWLLPACGGGSAACGTGSWQPGNLEIHHLALGQADATLIVAPDGSSLLVDAGEPQPESAQGARKVGAEVERILGCRRLDQVLITHFHLDHAGAVGTGGLWHLSQQQGFFFGRLHHRDLRRFSGEDGPAAASWRRYLEGAGPRLAPASLVQAGATLDLGPQVQLTVITADGGGALRPADSGGEAAWGAAPPSENDYSVALHLRFGRLDYFLGGDLSGAHLVRGAVSYHDIETVAARGLADMDVYRVNHHGSEHSSNPTFLGQIDPQVAIVSAGQDNPHGHPHRRTLERLLATGAVYLTSGAGRDWPPGVRAGAGPAVACKSADGIHFTVGADRFVADDPPRIDADGDGYFREVDPDDGDGAATPAPFGGCDPVYQRCSSPAGDEALVTGAERD
jgi:beta-lactamase superfamily II metal-dependent hydrolase